MAIEPAGLTRRCRLRTGLGTFLAVAATAPSLAQAEAAIEAAFAAMTAVERRMHPSRDGSDLARINTIAGAGDRSPPIPVHRSTWELLALAKRLNDSSGGVFDPCLPCRPGTLCDIELLPGLQLRCHAPVKLDFGGFAKGYAVDQAVAALLCHGSSAGLVNAGGDLRVFGPQPQTILLRQAAGALRSLPVANAAVAVSHIGTPRPPEEHAGYYLRATNSVGPRRESVAVMASVAVIADALTKCALLCSDRQFETVLRDTVEFAPCLL